MKYIFHCEPDDFILAGRAIKSVLEECHGSCGVGFDDGSYFWVKQNKNSVSVWKCE